MCYLIISESSQSELERRVSRKLNEGWELIGGVNVCFVRFRDNINPDLARVTTPEFIYSQALSKAPITPE